MPRISTRYSCEDLHSVDVRDLARDDLLNHGRWPP